MAKQKSVRLTGLWEQEDERGDKYLSAKVGANYFSIRKNSYKKADKEPDFFLYISQPDFNKTAEGESEKDSII